LQHWFANLQYLWQCCNVCVWMQLLIRIIS
jgi:hypothetical protein